MRVKQLWRHFDVPAKASLVWSRITFSSVTTAYFILAILHCLIQVIIQALAFSSNAAAVDHLWSLIQSQNQTIEGGGFAVLGDDLRICYTLPPPTNTASCNIIWQPNDPSSLSPGLAAAANMTSFASSVVNPSSSTFVAVNTSLPSVTQLSTNTLPSATQPPNGSIPLASSASNPVALPLTEVANVTASSNSVSTSTSQAVAATGTLRPPSPSPESDSTSPLLEVGVIPLFTPSKGKDLPGGNGDDTSLHHRGLSQRSDADSNSDLQPSIACVTTLIWPVQELDNTKRQDITLISFQIWVFGMSIVALLNESIPHIGVALFMHIVVTIWTVFQVFQTMQFRHQFTKIITNGACKQMNLLGSYWESRLSAEITSAVLNAVSSLVVVMLTYRLMKIYGWQTFKRVGASLTINRVYRLVLSLSIAIQISLFFVTAAGALWLDQLCNGSIGRFASRGKLYKGGVSVMFCLLIPWLSLGWFSVRREARRSILVFLVLNVFFIVLWAAMFDSTTFRWTFMLWPFFAFVAVLAGALLLLTLCLGFACRLNFGKGLPRYLNAIEPLDGDDFTPVFSEKGLDRDPEKVEFPSTGRPIPTFSATFGKGSEVPVPSHMRFQQFPGDPITRSASSSSSTSGTVGHLARNDSKGSQISHTSSNSTSSQRGDMGKRWVIE